MSGKRYSEEFKIEAVKQVTERNYPALQVASRLGVTSKSIYDWINRYGDDQAQHHQITGTFEVRVKTPPQIWLWTLVHAVPHCMSAVAGPKIVGWIAHNSGP